MLGNLTDASKLKTTGTENPSHNKYSSYIQVGLTKEANIVHPYPQYMRRLET